MCIRDSPKPYLSTIARLQAESKALYGPATPDAGEQADARAKYPIPEMAVMQ